MFAARTINRHVALLNTMAGTLGVDLTGAMATGSFQPEAWRGAVLRCTGCSDPDGCQHWLAEHAETGAGAAPDFCRNADLLARLKR